MPACAGRRTETPRGPATGRKFRPRWWTSAGRRGLRGPSHRRLPAAAAGERHADWPGERRRSSVGAGRCRAPARHRDDGARLCAPVRRGRPAGGDPADATAATGACAAPSMVSFGTD